jgi:GTP-binding protein
MIDFANSSFVKSAPTLKERPKDTLKEVVLLGRSNVGKSSLINSLVKKKLAFPSKSAGKTKTLNYFLVDDSFYLVDAPGYGYTSYGSREDESFAEMMEGYLDGNENLKGALLLVDGRRLLGEDERSLLKLLKEEKVPCILVYTKCDLLKQSELAKARKEAAGLNPFGVYFSKRGEDPKELRALIAKVLR